MTTDTLPANPLREHIILAIIGAVASSIVAILPLVFGALIDHLEFSVDVTGYVTTFNVFGIAAGAFLATGLIAWLDLTKGFVLSLAILALAEFASTLVTDSGSLSAIRFLSGLGSGLVSGCVAATITRMPKPERGFSFYMIGMFSISVIGLYLLPPYIAATGAKGLFILLGAISAGSILLLLMMRMPTHESQQQQQKSPAAPFKLDGISLTLLSWILFLMIGNGALWAFIERAGAESGFAPETVGLILSFSSLCGIGAALLMAPADRRFNSAYLVLLGAAVATISTLVLAWRVDSITFFTVGICLMSVAWAFTVPVAQSLLARFSTQNGQVEANSSFAALTMLMYWGGLALGPAIIGYVLSTTNSSQIAFWACGVCYGLSVLCAIPLVRSGNLRQYALTSETAA